MINSPSSKAYRATALFLAWENKNTRVTALGFMKSSTYSFSSLVKQTTQVAVGFLVMLLLTGGRPSAFVVNSSACLSIVFVAYSEARRLAKGKN